MSHFVIVGAGECGARAAFTLREKGFEGKISLIGREPVAPYERPPLSKGAHAGLQEPKFVALSERYVETSIDLMTDVAATGLDTAEKRIALSNGRSIAYDRLLLATGARARPFPGLQNAGKRIRSLRTHADAVALGEAMSPGCHIAIIGGGFIGLELAATACQHGAEVTLIEGLPRVLMRGVPEAIATVVAARHRAEGVDIRCAQGIATIEERTDAAHVILADGSSIEVDLVLIGIGALPEVELAEAAGLQVENGIAVNERLETSAKDVFAAGDCCSFPLALYGGRRVRLESWRNAQEQGMLAAANMLGANEAISSVPWFWSDQYDLTLQIAGLADSAATVVRRDLDDGAFILFHLDETGRLIAASGIGRGNVVARDIRLAEMLIAKRACPSAEALMSNSVKLKSLLAA